MSALPGEEPVFVIRNEAVARLVLNRPRSANSLNRDLVERMGRELRELDADPALRLIVIQAQGRTFCSGVDLTWMREAGQADEASNVADAMLLAQLLLRMRNLRVPLIGVVQGATAGAGVGIVACCDLVVASTAASFRLPEVRLGIVPAVISPFLLAKIGEAACRRYFLTAEALNVSEARRLGLVHEVCEPAALDAEVERLIAAIRLGLPEAVLAAKAMINDLAPLPIDAPLIEDMARRLAQIRQTPSAQAALSDFLHRRIDRK